MTDMTAFGESITTRKLSTTSARAFAAAKFTRGEWSESAYLAILDTCDQEDKAEAERKVTLPLFVRAPRIAHIKNIRVTLMNLQAQGDIKITDSVLRVAKTISDNIRTEFDVDSCAVCGDEHGHAFWCEKREQ